MVLLSAAALLLPGVAHTAAHRAGMIAFLRFTTHGSNAWTGGPRLFVVRADGTGLHRLSPPGVDVYGEWWSPDASRIAYASRKGSLYVVRADGTGRRRLVAGSRLPVWDASWSPDGSRIAFVAAPRPRPLGRTRIFVVPAGGGVPRQLPSGEAGGVAWSPLGGEIAYGHGGQIWMIPPDGTRAHAAFIDTEQGGRGGFGGPSWSSDGTRLAFGAGRYNQVYASDADGTDLHRVTTHAYQEYGIAFSPDGQTIAYGRENRGGIYLIGFDGRHDRRLTRDSPRPVAWGALSWSPDGSALAYATNRTGDGDIYVIAADGRNRTRLTSSPDNDIAPEWAPVVITR